MLNLKENVSKILDLLQEAEKYQQDRERLHADLKAIFDDYQRHKYSHSQYQEKTSAILKNRTKKEWEDYYDATIISVLKKIEFLNSQLFYDAYKSPAPEFKLMELPSVPKPSLKEERRQFFIAEFGRKIARLVRPKVPSKESVAYLTTREFIVGTFRRLFGVKQETYLGKEITIPKEAISIRKKEIPSIAPPTPQSAIAAEAARIRRVLAKKEDLRIYQPSIFGTIANMSIKRTSFFLIDSFPELFRYLYNALRLANIQMLSNTYVNIMVLTSILAMGISLIFFLAFFSLLGNPFALIISKTAILTILVGVISFIGFYAYPFAKISRRSKNMHANLTFAINHMSAVAASGVPPAKMLKLIAKSPEYGEISVEMEKIVELIEVFGYDFITAVRTVAAVTPSPPFKEFLNGMVSNIESGSDIKQYMTEKSKEAIVEYELERQKYAETISTFSDIYTGILIAAPLFFVSALSLVSILGGTVGGIQIDTLIVVGVYLVIPFLNIGFLILLQLTQPEI